MHRSSARSCSFRRNAASSISRRPLRLESLEPRLTLSAGALSQVVAAKTLASSSAVTLDAVADAYVSSSSKWTNYGTAADLLVQSGGARGATATTYLKFDVSSVSDVSKAVLNLTSLSTTSASSATIRIRLLSDSSDGWIEGTGGTSRGATTGITWSNSPNGAGITVTVSGSQLKKGSTISVDVTKLLQQWFNGNGIASFVIDVTPQGRNSSTVDFASSENATVAYRPTLTVSGSGSAPTVAQQPAVTSQTSTTVSLSVLGTDAEDAESSLKYTWSATSSTGAASPTFSVNGSNAAKSTTVTFSKAGTYVFTAKIVDSSGQSVTTSTVTVTVSQELTAISVTPSSVTLSLGESQTFTAAGVDQFGNAMAIASSVSWSAGKGSFSGGTTGTTATYVAPNSETATTVTATYGSFTATAAVTVVEANFLDLLDSDLAALTESLYADGSISRADMIAILRSVENESDGIVDSTDISDLKTIIKNSSTLSMANYVVVLASDVVYGSTANTYYLGSKLGNLSVGSTAAQLEKLIDKWFYGTDLPTTSYSYDTYTAGTLYGASNTVSHTDEKQGDLGDCYLLSALGSIADSSAAAIKNMIVDNGDGTWTVRFYSNGTADYVTVNSQLPVDSSGKLIYQGYGSLATSTNNELWLALIEKAYAQWNETGKTGRDEATNSYAAIEGGWMGDVYEQSLGYTATVYSQATTGSSAKQSLINAISAGEAVTIGTKSFNYNSTTGLYGNHAYNVISYNSSTGKFTLYNPWGSNQPSQLTWSQLQTYCDAFAATVTSGSASASTSLAQSHFTRSLIAPPVVAAPAISASTLDTPPPQSAASETNGELKSASAQGVVYSAAVDAVFAERTSYRTNSQQRFAAALRPQSEWLSNDTVDDALDQTATDWGTKIDFLYGV
jgi:hypothetical protein